MGALDTLSIGCPLVQWNGEKGHCNWCDKELTGRQQRWCSPECTSAYGRNHWWGDARKAALERDGYTCVRCGFVGWVDVPWSVLEVRWTDDEIDQRGANLRDWAVALGLLDLTGFERLGWYEQDRVLKMAYERLPESIHGLVRIEGLMHMGRKAPMSVRQQDSWRRRHQLEVNHIVPCEGKHSITGCWHHLDGLETLCRPCHLVAGREQRAAKKRQGVLA
jgi:5-methylcytosine-specific restriction endonuclease McrA